MWGMAVIEVRGLTKRYGQTVAVEGLSFQVRPGFVTGFLGPNGAGKSTTLRMILGLAAPSAGEARIEGQAYNRLRYPLCVVGAMLDATAVDGGRTPDGHLSWLARSNRIDRQRVGSVLAQVGLQSAANQRIGSFSLGMKVRLGIAAALLGDPGVLIFDEPQNGLDPEGVRWLRTLCRSLAKEGRTLLISSHLMSEMELTADRLIIIGGGRLIADTSVDDLLARNQQGIMVRSPRAADLAGALGLAGGEGQPGPGGALLVAGLSTAEIAQIAADRGIPIHEMTPRSLSLEDIYMNLTCDAVNYRTTPRGSGTEP